MLKLLTQANQMDVSDVCLYIATRGGGSFQSWCDVYHDNDIKIYYISKVIGGIDANISIGTGEYNDGTLFREALTNEKWDIIITDTQSLSVPYYEDWKGSGDDGYLNEFLLSLSIMLRGTVSRHANTE